MPRRSAPVTVSILVFLPGWATGEERHVVVGISRGRPRGVSKDADDRPDPIRSRAVVIAGDEGETGRGGSRIAFHAAGGRDEQVPGRAVDDARGAKVRAELAAADREQSANGGRPAGAGNGYLRRRRDGCHHGRRHRPHRGGNRDDESERPCRPRRAGQSLAEPACPSRAPVHSLHLTAWSARATETWPRLMVIVQVRPERGLSMSFGITQHYLKGSRVPPSRHAQVPNDAVTCTIASAWRRISCGYPPHLTTLRRGGAG